MSTKFSYVFVDDCFRIEILQKFSYVIVDECFRMSIAVNGENVHSVCIKYASLHAPGSLPHLGTNLSVPTSCDGMRVIGMECKALHSTVNFINNHRHLGTICILYTTEHFLNYLWPSRRTEMSSPEKSWAEPVREV